MMRSKQVTLALLKCTKINIKKSDKRERNEGIQCEGGNEMNRTDNINIFIILKEL